MLPYSFKVPTLRFVIIIDLLIAFHISIKFLVPKLLVTFRTIPVFTAGMSKAGVDENDNLVFLNGDIRCPAKGAYILPETNPMMPKCSGDPIFKLRLCTDRLHDITPFFSGH